MNKPLAAAKAGLGTTSAKFCADLAEVAARTWLVTFINGEVLRRYQEPVALDRVLSEHHAALAAVPVEG